MPSIATIITYCTNDYRFIGKCIEEAKLFSSQILIPVCDHFFDGTPENRHLLEHTYAEHPDCQFIEFTYMRDKIYSQYHSLKPDDPDWSIFWTDSTRYIAFQYLDPSIEYVLFLDSDEIVEGKQFLAWFGSPQSTSYEVERLGAYFYALQPTLRAKNVVNLPLFVKRKSFAPLTFFNELDRMGAYLSHPGPKKDKVLGLNGRPFIHHYSWVRTKEECLWKSKTWGHRNDEDWATLIEEAFNGKMDKLFGTTHAFETIESPYFDPFRISYPTEQPPSPGPHVLKINERDLRRKEIEYALL